MIGSASFFKAARRHLSLIAALLGACGGANPGPTGPPDPSASAASVPLVIEDVNVISMASDVILSGRTVVVSDGRVTAIGDRTTAHPPGATVISGRGRYLIPSLIDMHVLIRTADVEKYVRFGIQPFATCGAGRGSRR